MIPRYGGGLQAGRVADADDDRDAIGLPMIERGQDALARRHRRGGSAAPPSRRPAAEAEQATGDHDGRPGVLGVSVGPDVRRELLVDGCAADHDPCAAEVGRRSAATIARIEGIVVVRSADRPMSCGRCSPTAVTNWSGVTFTPKVDDLEVRRRATSWPPGSCRCRAGHHAPSR